MIRASQNHWFSLIRPARKSPYFWGTLRGSVGWLAIRSRKKILQTWILQIIVYIQNCIYLLFKKTNININIIIYISFTIVYDMMILYHNNCKHNKYIRIYECDMWILTNYICDCYCQESIIYMIHLLFVIVYKFHNKKWNLNCTQLITFSGNEECFFAVDSTSSFCFSRQRPCRNKRPLCSGLLNENGNTRTCNHTPPKIHSWNLNMMVWFRWFSSSRGVFLGSGR